MLRIVKDRFGACVLRKSFGRKSKPQRLKPSGWASFSGTSKLVLIPVSWFAARANPWLSPFRDIADLGEQGRRGPRGLRGLNLRVKWGRTGFRDGLSRVVRESGARACERARKLGYRHGAAAAVRAASACGTNCRLGRVQLMMTVRSVLAQAAGVRGRRKGLQRYGSKCPEQRKQQQESCGQTLHADR